MASVGNIEASRHEAFLSCRTISIGSYTYTPKEKVRISIKGVKINAPSLKNESKHVNIQIDLKNIVKMLVYYDKQLPVIYLEHTFNISLRKALDIGDECLYCNSMYGKDPCKNITLLLEVITDETKHTLKTLFHKAKINNIIGELDFEGAKEILARAWFKGSMSASISSGPKSSNPAEIRQILIYPPGEVSETEPSDEDLTQFLSPPPTKRSCIEARAKPEEKEDNGLEYYGELFSNALRKMDTKTRYHFMAKFFFYMYKYNKK